MTITQSDFDALKAEVAQLRSEIGVIPDFQRDGYLDNPVHTRMHEIGLAIDADVAAVGNFEKRLAAVEARPTAVVQTPPAATAEVPAGVNLIVREIWLKAGGVMHQIINSENDGGLGVLFNSGFGGQGWRPGSSHVDPRLPQIMERFERDGVWSLKYFPPDLDPNPNTADEFVPGEYDGLGGKAFLVKVAGRNLHGETTQTVIIGTGEPGRDIDIGIVPKGGTPNEPVSRLRCRESGVFVVDPDGTERKL